MKKFIKKTTATTLSTMGILSAMPSAFCTQVKENYNLGRYHKIPSSDVLVVGKDSKCSDHSSTSKNVQPIFFLAGSFDVCQFKKVLVDNKIIDNKKGKLSDKWECELEVSAGDPSKGYSVAFNSDDKKIVFLFDPNKIGRLNESDYNFILAYFCELKGIIMPFLNNDLTISDSATKIDDKAFFNNASLKNITIPLTVTSIGNDAFAMCTELEKVYIQNSVQNIGKYAFNICVNLNEIYIPNSVQNIGEGAFWGCVNLKKVYIPNSVQNIGEYAFNGCMNLKEIYIPNSVQNIGEHAFKDCVNLKCIYFNGKVYNNVKSFMAAFRNYMKNCKK